MNHPEQALFPSRPREPSSYIVYECSACNVHITLVAKPPQKCACGEDLHSHGDNLGRYHETDDVTFGKHLQRILDARQISITQLATLVHRSPGWVAERLKMARYLETAAKLKDEVDSFMAQFVNDIDLSDPENFKKQAAVALGHIINLSVRCSPRGVQGTVRKNIVATAMEEHCNVTMTKEQQDNDPTRTYNKIHISAK